MICTSLGQCSVEPDLFLITVHSFFGCLSLEVMYSHFPWRFSFEGMHVHFGWCIRSTYLPSVSLLLCYTFNNLWLSMVIIV